MPKQTVEQTQSRRKKNDLIRKFGINKDQFDAILENQNFVCAICKNPDPLNRALAVDHCHVTKKVRGLLCTNCNMALGKFQDNVDYLKAAVDYLQREFCVPDIEDTIKHKDRNDRPNWKMLVTTPDGKFPSLQHAAKFYKVDPTTIRNWCLPGKYKKEGYSCEKKYMSLNEIKEYCNVKN
jgi:hypothetical protein